jgi:hypothetical protein
MNTSGILSNSQNFNYKNNINKRNNDIFNTDSINRRNSLNNLESPTQSLYRNNSALYSRVIFFLNLSILVQIM